MPCSSKQLATPHHARWHLLFLDYIHKMDNCHSDKMIALTNYRFTSGSCCRSSASITGGAFPSSHNSLNIETSSPIPSSKKDGGMTLSKDGWVYGSKCY